MLCIRASSTAGMKKNSYFRLFFSVSVFSFSLCLSFFNFFFLQPSFIHRCFTSAFNCVIHCVNERLATAHSVTC